MNFCLFSKRLIILSVLVLTVFNTYGQSHFRHKFTIYAFIPWKNEKYTTPSQFSNYLHSFGIRPIKVIYEHNFFTQGKVDSQKIKKIADESIKSPNIPISFDVEFGNRFQPETVIPRVKDIVHYYRSYQGQAPVGIYGTIPQNTYSWNSRISNYDKLNEKYKLLVSLVDYLSPVLYNYDGNNFSSWLKSAKYNIEAAKKFAPAKPIIPYVSPVITLRTTNIVKQGHIVEELDEASMTKRLQTLYELGASGCIIWASSQDRTKEGKVPAFDPQKAWGKAVVEFLKTHH